jgi:RNase P/RNase MRP subunit POP5
MKMIVGLGSSRTADANARAGTLDAQGHDTTTEAGLTRAINELVERARREGNAIVMASTNSQQELAVQVLRASGFARSRWAEKSRHPETRVRLWYKRLNPNGV